MGVYDHDFAELLEKGYRPPLEYNRQNPDRDKNLFKKLRNPLTTEQYLEKHPEDRDNVRRENLKRVALERAKQQELEELEDEEYDYIYYAQEDDTVNESYDGDYNPYGHNIYDEKLPEDFDLWDNRVKNAWREAHKIGEEI